MRMGTYASRTHACRTKLGLALGESRPEMRKAFRSNSDVKGWVRAVLGEKALLSCEPKASHHGFFMLRVYRGQPSAGERINGGRQFALTKLGMFYQGRSMLWPQRLIRVRHMGRPFGFTIS